MKYLKIAIAFILIITFLSSCSTKMLWENTKYRDTVTKFLITSDSKKLIVLGKQYHYVFPIDKNLKNILESEERKFLTPLFENLIVYENNNIKGDYSLIYNSIEKLDVNNKWLLVNGFKVNKIENSNKISYIYMGKLSGTRYLPKDKIYFNHEFNKGYDITVEIVPSNLDITGRILYTPIAVAEDGVVVFAVGVLLVTLAPVGLLLDAVVPEEVKKEMNK